MDWKERTAVEIEPCDGNPLACKVMLNGVSSGTFSPSKEGGQIQTENGPWHMQLPWQGSNCLGDSLAHTMPWTKTVLKFRQCPQSQTVMSSCSEPFFFYLYRLNPLNSISHQFHLSVTNDFVINTIQEGFIYLTKRILHSPKYCKTQKFVSDTSQNFF